MRSIGKFEWKIIMAQLVTAAAPLVFTWLMVDRLIEESMSVGLNEQVLSQLRSGVDLYKEVIESRKRIVHLQGEKLSQDPEVARLLQSGEPEGLKTLVTGLLAESSSIYAVRLRKEGVPDLEIRSRILSEEGSWKSKTDSWDLQAGYVLDVTFVIATEFLEAHKRLRELLVTLEDVKQNFQPWKMGYYRLFLFIYTWILVAAVLLGVLLSRSVTGRVAKLVDATKRASQGDLDVRVPVRGRDEIGGLSESFNSMMDDIQRGRDRIVYLEKVSSWQEIARRLAHEIKNPLTPIQLVVQELHETYRGDDDHFRKKLEDSVEIVKEEIGSLRHMVQTFSEFAKLPSVHTESTDLSEFVSEFLKHNPQYADTVRYFPEDKPVRVQLDHILMGRVLTNLINNGLEASQDRQSVEIEVVGGPGWGTLRVVDHGKGLTAEVRENMFQPYFTTKAQGTGLGLAIVKKIVLQHGGEISVLDGEDSGTVIAVRFQTEEGVSRKAQRGEV